MRRRARLIVFLALLGSFSGELSRVAARQPDVPEIAVSLSASLDRDAVPLNRTALLSIRISWEGDLDRIGIGQLTDPVLENLTAVEAASSNRVVAETGTRRAVKEVSYTLKPKSLGMAYIEPLTLSYEDRSTGKVDNLKTPRLSLEVVEALPEPDSRIFRVAAGAAAIVVLAAAAIISLGFFRKRKAAETPVEPAPLVEETYLQYLKTQVELGTGATGERFETSSRLLRRYLAAKYGLAAMEITTRELVEALPGVGLEAETAQRCAELLSTSDRVKFSGQEVSVEELQSALSTVRILLETNLSDARHRRDEEESTKGKRRNKSGERA